MDDHSGGFVNYREVLVFVNDIERDIFGLKSRDRQFDQVNLDLVIFANLVRGFYRFSLTRTSSFSMSRCRRERDQPSIFSARNASRRLPESRDGDKG